MSEIEESELNQSKAYKRAERAYPNSPRNTLEEVQEEFKQRKGAEGRQKEVLLQLAGNDIVGEILKKGGVSGSGELVNVETETMSSKSYSFAQLQARIVDFENKLEDVDTSENLISEQIEESKKSFENNGFITTKDARGNSSSIHGIAIDDYVLEKKGDIAVLKAARSRYMKVLQALRDEANERTKSSRVSEILKEMTSLVHKAEKLTPSIRKANQRAQKTVNANCRVDVRSCKQFVSATAEFSDLNIDYLQLRSELDFYCINDPRTPVFPVLGDDDTSAKNAILAEWRRL